MINFLKAHFYKLAMVFLFIVATINFIVCTNRLTDPTIYSAIWALFALCYVLNLDWSDRSE